MHPRLDQALTAAGGVLLRRHHPQLKASIDHAVRQRQLVRLLPGIYARTQDATRLEVKARAACLADPNAVITGAAAAILGGWDHLRRPEEVTVASQGLRRPQPGFRFERRHIAPELVRKIDGVRIAVRALAVLDLAAEGGDFHLEDALRRGVGVADLRRALALSPGRRGFAPLREVVHLLRDEPWSPLETEAHKLLRQAHVPGWEANRGIYDKRGETLLGYGDLVFADFRLVIELNGEAFHSDPESRDRDEARDLRLEREGWEVIRLRSGWVFRRPTEFVAAVQDILRTREWRRRAA